MRLAEPTWLVLLALTPLPWLVSRRRAAVSWPTLDGFRSGAGRWRGVVPAVLRGLMIASVAVALARPQTVAGRTRVGGRGVTIVVALDHSSSMNTEDFPTAAGPVARLDAAKATLTGFVEGRADDLLGLVVFANYPDLTCAPTLDHAFLVDSVRAVRPARAGDDGTNLGDALVFALDALKDAPTRKKAVVLLTDGRNSPAVPNPTDPLAAARIARGMNVTVHTIAVGQGGVFTREVAPGEPLRLSTEVEGPDLELLARLAETAGGRAFQATDVDALHGVFRAIDALEKSPVRGDVLTRYREDYAPWAAAAVGLVALDLWLTAGRARRLP